MADKNWRTNPKIQVAETVAKQFSFDAVIIMGFKSDGTGAFEIISYGSTGPICKEVANLADGFTSDFKMGILA